MPQPVLTVAQCREADRAAEAAGVSGWTLLQAAGAGVAEAVRKRFAPCPVAVLCGPGLNGGDGYVAARALADAGWPVRVLALAEPVPADARRARDAWTGPVEDLSPEALGGAALVIDALFGAGLSRPIPAFARRTLEAAEAHRLPIVAVDLPSGLDGDTGKPLDYAPQAQLTVTFHAYKPGHLLLPGRRLCGEIMVVDIGIPPAAAPRATVWENGPDLWLERFPWPSEEAHKHQRGKLGVVSGGPTATGAARLAARAGLRVGAGLVRVYATPEAAPVYAPHLEAVMLSTYAGARELGEQAQVLKAAIIGPAAGLDQHTRDNLAALAAAPPALVVDADAITLYRDDPEALFALLEPRDVLTPHEGEFDRIFPGLLQAGPDRLTIAQEAARRAGAVVVLKGPDTVIAAPDGRAAINTNGARWLATAGSGDVLAGLIGGMLAQGLDSFDAACAGVWIHAEAGARFGPGLIAEDLPEQIPAVLKTLWLASQKQAEGTAHPSPG